jgi:hypothetical protein
MKSYPHMDYSEVVDKLNSNKIMLLVDTEYFCPKDFQRYEIVKYLFTNMI